MKRGRALVREDPVEGGDLLAVHEDAPSPHPVEVEVAALAAALGLGAEVLVESVQGGDPARECGGASRRRGAHPRAGPSAWGGDRPGRRVCP